MFLNPFMLFGLAAVSIPIVIHLLNNRRIIRMRWAAMRFLRASIERNRRRMRVEDLLLLIVRCAVVCLIALALARPVLRSAAGGWLGRSSVTAVLILDNSASMSGGDGVNTRFDLAKQAANQAIDSLPSGSSVAVWLASDGVRPLIPEPTMEMNLARIAVRDATLSARGSDAIPPIKDAIETLKRRTGTGKEIYYITDGQAIGFARTEQLRQMLDVAKQDARARLILVGDRIDENLAISELRQATGIAAVDRPLRFELTVANTGTTAQLNVRVTLNIDDDPNPVADAVIDTVEAGKSRTLSMFARLRSPGYHTVTANLSHDRMPADDTRSIALRAVEKVNVLVVDGDPKAEPRDAESFFLNAALVPVSPAEADGYFIHTTTISPTELASASIDDFDCIVLANVADFGEPTADAIAARVTRRGGLIVFPGDRTNLAFYNKELFERLKLLPARFGDPKGEAKSEQTVAKLQDRNFEHPIARLWNDPASGSPSSANFFRIVPLVAPENDEAKAGIVMRFVDNAPAMMEKPFGDGRVIQFASTADTEWNDLPVKPGVFVPLMYQCLGSIVSRGDEALTLRAGEKLSLRPPPETIGQEAVITTPVEQPATRARQSRRVELVETRALLTFDDTDVAGPYELKLPDQPSIKFVSQVNAVESDLRAIDPDQQQALASVADIIDLNRTPQIASAIEERRVGKELWIPLAIAVLSLAAMESLLAFWFSRAK